MVKSPLWLQKISDRDLKKLLGGIIDVTNPDGGFSHMITTYPDVCHHLDIWYGKYPPKVGFEMMSMDVFREASLRWLGL